MMFAGPVDDVDARTGHRTKDMKHTMWIVGEEKQIHV